MYYLITCFDENIMILKLSAFSYYCIFFLSLETILSNWDEDFLLWNFRRINIIACILEVCFQKIQTS